MFVKQDVFSCGTEIFGRMYLGGDTKGSSARNAVRHIQQLLNQPLHDNRAALLQQYVYNPLIQYMGPGSVIQFTIRSRMV